MEWSNAPVDLYCERLGPGLWAEPLNALSNLAFLLAGLLLWRRSRRKGDPGPTRALPVLIVLISLGSGAFHTFATRWAEILDVAFIALFIDWFVACYARYRWRAPWWLALVSVGLYHLAGWALTRPFAPEALNGSVPYLPALTGLVVFGLLSSWKDGLRHSQHFFLAAAVFALSLTLRTLDQQLCPSLTIGTHWLWHLLNAVTLTLVTLAIVKTPGLPRSRF